MKAATTWEQHEETDLTDETGADASVELKHNANSDGHSHEEQPKLDLYSKTTALKRLVHSLLMEVQSLDDIPAVDFKEGIDFYDEVRRFEIALIQHALAQTGGHQLRAARLLNMKVTTLNSKIKHYDIRLDVLVGGLYVPNAGGNGAREQA
jgi:transcriptional regulator with GAF, ATPase, and Fis domain